MFSLLVSSNRSGLDLRFYRKLVQFPGRCFKLTHYGSGDSDQTRWVLVLDIISWRSRSIYEKLSSSTGWSFHLNTVLLDKWKLTPPPNHLELVFFLFNISLLSEKKPNNGLCFFFVCIKCGSSGDKDVFSWAIKQLNKWISRAEVTDLITA